MARTALTYIATEYNLTREEMVEIAGGQYSSRNTTGLIADIDGGVLYAQNRRDAATMAARAEAYATSRDAAQATTEAHPEADPEIPATPAQVSYIMSLIHRGAHQEGGFMFGPTTPAGVAALSKGVASLYITSLTGRY